jgi:hypothetical protein
MALAVIIEISQICYYPAHAHRRGHERGVKNRAPDSIELPPDMSKAHISNNQPLLGLPKDEAWAYQSSVAGLLIGAR